LIPALWGDGFECRSATARGGVAKFFSRKIFVTESSRLWRDKLPSPPRITFRKIKVGSRGALRRGCFLRFHFIVLKLVFRQSKNTATFRSGWPFPQ